MSKALVIVLAGITVAVIGAIIILRLQALHNLGGISTGRSSDWHFFQSDLGYELRYPPRWTHSSQCGFKCDSDFFEGPGISFSISEYNPQFSPNDPSTPEAVKYLESIESDGKGPVVHETSTAGISVWKVDYQLLRPRSFFTDGDLVPAAVYAIEANGHLYVIAADYHPTNDTEDRAIFQEFEAAVNTFVPV